MSLEAVIEETRKALEEAKAKEEGLEVAAEEPKPEEAAPEPEAEPAKEEPKPEGEPPAKEEPKPEAQAEKTAADYARERRERASLAAKLQAENEALKARLDALEAATKPKQAADAEPNKDEDPVAYFEWKTRQLENQLAEQSRLQQVMAEESIADKKARIAKETEAAAFGELAQFKEKARATKPDLDQAESFYFNALAYSYKIQNPNLSDKDIADKVNKRLLTRAAEAMRDGYENPVDALYEDAKKYGYQKSALAQVKEETKPDMAKVAGYRARNAGMAGAAGRGAEGDLTPTGALGLTAGEWAKLSPEKKRAVFAQLRMQAAS